MKIASSCSLVLVLALASIGEAQKKARRTEPPAGGESGCVCGAGGADCLFGNASGCHVPCPGDTCSCQGAYCRLGFPFGSSCHC